MVDTGADPAHDAARLHADLEPERRAFVGGRGQEPEGRHDVAEVERRRLHVDLDHARPERRRLVRLHLQSADLPRVVEAQAVGGIVARGDVRGGVADALDAWRPHAPPAHRDLAIAQIAAGERAERLQIAGGAEIDETEVDSGVLAHLDRHAAHRAPQPAPARVVHLEGGPARHDGDAAPGMRMLGAVQHERPHERDKGRHHPLAGGVARVAAAEEVDGLQVGHPRPVGDAGRVAGEKGLEGERVRLGPVEQREPVGRQAVGLAQHPAGSGDRRGMRGRSRRPGRLEQRGVRTGANDGPAGGRIDRVRLGVRDQRQATGHQQAPAERPVRRIEGVFCIVMKEEDLGRTRAQQAGIERIDVAGGRIEVVEAQRGVGCVKRLVVLPGGLLVVADEPELAMRRATGE